MKKAVSTLLVFVMVLAMFSGGLIIAHAAENPTVKIGSECTVVGEEVEVDISIENNPGLIALKLTVEFDKTLELTSVENTGVLGFGTGDGGDEDNYEEFICGNEKVSPFILCWDAKISDEANNFTGNGVIAVLKFKANEIPEGGSADIKVTVNDAYDYDLAEYTVSVVDGEVTVTEGQSVSGKVTSYNSNTDEIKVELYKAGEDTAAYSATVIGNSADYSIVGVAAGTYTMKVSKANHVTREYTVTVGEASVEQDVKIHLKGDVTGDGRVNATDLSRIKAHVSKKNPLTGYLLLCGNVAGSGTTVNATDLSRIKAHVSKSNPLW